MTDITDLITEIDAEAATYDPVTDATAHDHHESLTLAGGSDMAERIAEKVIASRWLADVKAAAWTEGWQALEFWDGADDASRNPYKCRACEAVPGDNDHCVYDGEPHGWHRCDGIVPNGSNCPGVGNE